MKEKNKEQNFERELPASYKQVYRLNAKDAKTGIIINVIAFVVWVFVMILAVAARWICPPDSFFVDYDNFIITSVVFIAVLLAYMILHELVHGIAYKGYTGEKLTFGISWSCAFCGVPNIYTYRKTALVAVAAPLVVFALILIPATVILYFIDPIYYLLSACLFGLHLGGCSGDIYVMYIFLFKIKDKKALMKDTGPDMTVYTPQND